MRRLFTLFAAALVLAAASAAQAAEYEMPEVSVTATRSEQEMIKLPRNVTVITREQIEEIDPLTVTDLLEYVPGLVVRDYTGTGSSAAVDLRGFGETGDLHTLVTVDGRRLNQIDLSGVDFTTIPVENIERIEILHGPAGVLYGDSAVGGVINIVTKEGAAGFGGNVEGRYGSYNLYGGRGSVRGGNDKVGYFLSARYDHTDGYRDNSATNLRNATFNVRYFADDSLSFLVDGGIGRSDYGLPGSLTAAQIEQDRRQTLNPTDYAKNTDGTIRGQVRKDGGKWGVFTADLSYRGRRAESEIWDRDETDINTLAAQPKWVLDGPLGALSHRLTLGLDYYYVQMTKDTFTIGGPKKTSTDYKLSSFGPYALEEIDLLPGLVLTFGGRYQTARYDIEIKPVGQSSSSDTFDDPQWAATVGLTYRFLDGAKVYARFARTFRYPTVEEYVTWGTFNPNLKPEKIVNYEIGGEYTFLKTGRISIAGYIMLLEDEIAYNPATYLNENLDETSHSGVEASLRLPLGTPRAHLFGSLSLMRARFAAGQYDDKRLPLVPEFKATLGLTARLVSTLRGTIRLTHVGSRFNGSDKANVYDKLPGYTKVDLHLDYTYKRVKFFLNVDNLFNAKYSSYGYADSWGPPTFYPEPELAVWGGVSVGF